MIKPLSVSDCLCIGRQCRGNHKPAKAPFAFFAVRSGSNCEHSCLKYLVINTFPPVFGCLPEVAVVERGVDLASGWTYTFLSAMSSCNMLRVCTL